MSKTKSALSLARETAKDLVKILSPGCDRIEIAGSIRRGKRYVGDIEIVCVPKWTFDLFGKRRIEALHALDAIIYELISNGTLQIDDKNGRKYQKYWLPNAGIHLDLFLTTPECWGLILAIRTGPADFSHKLVTQKWRGGFLPDEYRVYDGRILREDQPIDTPEESDVFDLIGGWIEPKDRK